MSETFDGPRMVDQCALARRTRHLGPKAFRSYHMLIEYYWEVGRLFCEDGDLADVCKLSVQSFRRIREQISRLFRIDDTGLWRDHRLERERAAAIVAAGLDPAEFTPQAPTHPGPAGDGGPRSPRSIAGQRNAEERWRRERAAKDAELAAREAAVAERERQADARAAAAAGGVGIAVGIVSHANGMPTGMLTDANSHADGIGLARSHLARPSEEDEEEEIDKSSSSSSTQSPRASGAEAVPDANSHPASHAKPAPAAMPTGDAKPAKAGAGPQARPALSDAELRDALLSAIGGKVEAGCRDPHTVGPIRGLMEEGCDLHLHILPELRLLAASSRPLKTWRAGWLHEQIRKRRDALPDAPGAARAPAPETAFVAADSAQWAACQARERAEGRPERKPLPNGKTGQTGHWFTVPLPAVDRPAVAAE